MNYFFILTLVLYGVTATPISITNDNNQRIVGGFDASPRQFPYQASIRNQSMEYFCSGSIISNQWILTSGTCLRHVKLVDLRVVVGSIYLDNGGTTHTALFIVEYPGSNDNNTRDDIGLIRVNGKITFNNFVKPIALFGGDTLVDLPLTVSSWGSPTFWDPTPSNILRFVTLKAKSKAQCKRTFPLFVDTHLCTGKFNPTRQGLCHNDAGSPLVYNGEQHAVASITMYCAFLLPDVHTRVASYRDWIKDVTNT